jgi:DNA-binding MarR family transcriptional regulator
MGVAEDAFACLRRIAFEGEHMEKMAAFGARTKLAPGVIKTLMRVASTDGVAMGELARRMNCDPSYVTALVDDLTERGLATREPDLVDRRVKCVALTEMGRALADEIRTLVSVPPPSFNALSRTELRQLCELLEKVAAADSALSVEAALPAPMLKATAS